MSENFEQLGIQAPLVSALLEAGIVSPTKIQELVIPAASTGKDIIGQSPTGTGKTLAYLLPLLQKINPEKREMQALILAPTHELAIQILRQIEWVVEGAALSVTSASVIGDVNVNRQIEKLKEKPHVLVGSSGRILELIQKRKITAHTIKTIIIDEADKLLDEHNMAVVRSIIKATLRERQIMVFSATMNPATIDKALEFMKDPEVIKVSKQPEVAQDITHMYFLAEQRDKIDLLRKLIYLVGTERALVFINRSYDIENVVAKLNHHGLKVDSLFGSSIKTDRKKALENFRNGKVQFLIASDLAARGLDIPGISYVFNLDIPEDPQIYLHRVGRTGRSGQSGIAVSIVTLAEQASIVKYEKTLKINIAVKRLSGGRVMDGNARQNRKTVVKNNP